MTERTPAAVIAHNLTLTGDEGPVFGPLSLTIAADGLTVLTGRGGSGRTALALTIAGRMAPTAGELTVLGETRRPAIRRRVAIAGVDQIDHLDRDVRVATVLSEHRNWSRAWIRPRRRADEEYLAQICGRLYGHRDLPELRSYISELSGLDRILLRICLALAPADGSEIGLLIMDDLEQVRELDDRRILLELLSHLTTEIPVIINAVNPLPPDAPPHTAIDIFTDHAHRQPLHSGLAAETTD